MLDSDNQLLKFVVESQVRVEMLLLMMMMMMMGWWLCSCSWVFLQVVL